MGKVIIVVMAALIGVPMAAVKGWVLFGFLFKPKQSIRDLQNPDIPFGDVSGFAGSSLLDARALPTERDNGVLVVNDALCLFMLRPKLYYTTI